ncbi:MAG: hypothetical protein HFH37_08495 [Lachnospiraceae bacterium]|jgi:hypothetical protein|nr:hypothetical protein [Lachnospiraceae bacterium]
MRTKVKKWISIFLVGAGSLLVGMMINFIPTWNLKTPDMHVLSGDWLNVYYETEKDAAKDVFTYANAQTASIAEKLGFCEKQDVNVYIYDYQATMQTKKYGFIAPLLGLDWYIGDNIGTNVILTSPANPGEVHDYDNNKYAVLHEIIHAYVSVINENVDLWLTEGVALYLSNGEPFCKAQLEYLTIPTYNDTISDNPLTFSNCGGYTFAHTYIEYLDATYGWDKVLKLIETENYEECFHKSKKKIYEEWVYYIENYDQ